MQFLVKKGRVSTPHGDYCLPGITRSTVSFMMFFMKSIHFSFIVCSVALCVSIFTAKLNSELSIMLVDIQTKDNASLKHFLFALLGLFLLSMATPIFSFGERICLNHVYWISLFRLESLIVLTMGAGKEIYSNFQNNFQFYSHPFYFNDIQVYDAY